MVGIGSFVEIERCSSIRRDRPLDRQLPILDRKPQFGGDPGLPSIPAMAFARQHVGPPLQPHFARQRLAHLLADPGNLDIEGIDCQQRAALAGRHEQRGCVAGKIVGSHQLRAEISGNPQASPAPLMAPAISGRRDPSPLADHDVVGADRGAGLHRVEHHPQPRARPREAPAEVARRRYRCR